jgi:MFS family permease
MDASGILRALRHRNFRLFISGQAISLIGTWMQRIAMGWLVYRLTGSVFLLGLVGFVGQIPTFLLAPFAGVIADRHDRYRIVIVTQVLAMLQAFILAFLVLTGAIEVWHIIVLGLVLGIINAQDVPARQSFFIEMVENKDDLGNAIALNSSIVNAGRLIGPSLAGILIALVGEGVCFLINGISYIAVIVALFAMTIKPRKIEKKNGRILTDIREGFSYVFHFAPIRSILLLLSLVSLVGMPYTILMPVIARDVLHGGPHTLGFLMAGSGAGALVGAFYLASRSTVVGLGAWIARASFVFGVGLMLMSLSHEFWLSLSMVIIVGFGMMVQLASSNTILQTIVEDDKRGRVMSFYAMAFMGTAPFGSLLSGCLASAVGTLTTLFIGGCCCVAGSIFFAVNLPSLRKVVHPIYVKKGIIREIAAGIGSATDLTAPPEEY